MINSSRFTIYIKPRRLHIQFDFLFITPFVIYDLDRCEKPNIYAKIGRSEVPGRSEITSEVNSAANERKL